MIQCVDEMAMKKSPNYADEPLVTLVKEDPKEKWRKFAQNSVETEARAGDKECLGRDGTTESVMVVTSSITVVMVVHHDGHNRNHNCSIF